MAMSIEDDRSLTEFVDTLMKQIEELTNRVSQLERSDVKITRFDDYIEVPALATEDIPETPSSGFVRIYAKVDGSVYKKNDAGTENSLG